jgi:hypothetical protein
VFELKGRVAILEARLNTLYNARPWKLWQSLRQYPRLANFMRRWLNGKQLPCAATLEMEIVNLFRSDCFLKALRDAVILLTGWLIGQPL